MDTAGTVLTLPEEPNMTESDIKELPVSSGGPDQLHGVFPETSVTLALMKNSSLVLSHMYAHTR